MASKKELTALITLAGKVDPSLQASLFKAANTASKSSSKISKLGGVISKTFATAGKIALITGGAIGAGALAGTLALGKMLNTATNTGDEIMKLKDKTGISAEELQRLQYITGQLGAKFEAIPTVMGALTKNMAAARSGSKETAAAFQALGVKVTDSTGKLRPQSAVFKETLAQLSKVKNQSERNALAFKLYGKSAADLFPLLNAGSGEIKKLASEADKLGLVMSGDQIAALDNLGDSMDKIKSAAKGIGNQIIGKLLPKIQPLIDKVVDKLPSLIPAISDGAGGFIGNILDTAGKFAPVISEVMGTLSKMQGSGLMSIIEQAMPVILQLAQLALPLINEGFGMLMSVIQPLIPDIMKLAQELLPVMAQVVTILFEAMEPLLPVFVDLVHSLLPPFMDLLKIILPILQDLTPVISGVANVISTLLTIAVQGITMHISTLVDGLKTAVDLFKRVNGLGADKTYDAGYDSIDPLGALPHKALGGIARIPSLCGEAGPEMVIPLERSPRSLGLLTQAAGMLGFGSSRSGSGRGSGTGAPSMVFNFNFNGTVSNRDDVVKGVEMAKEYLYQIIDDYFHDQDRDAFSF